MSLLYKDEKDLVYEVEIRSKHSIPQAYIDKITFIFSNDGGKFGTHEILDEHELTPLELLEILQKHFHEE